MSIRAALPNKYPSLMPTLKTLLTTAADTLTNYSDSPLLDAEVLLGFVLDKPRTYLRAWCDNTPTAQQQRAFADLIAQRQHGVPIAYLTGTREFWSREFTVTPAVLIPRPDTELLIELALNCLAVQPTAKVLDLGTGSGIIAVTLAAEYPTARVSAADISSAALAVAQHNAKQHQTYVDFYLSDWFANIPFGLFDLIISNPPYIADDDPHLQQGDVRFEPQGALVAADQGLRDITLLVAAARAYLTTGGQLLIEHGYNQQHAVHAIFNRFNYADIQTAYDLSGQPRVTYAHWQPSL
jgi:release factor glutamine methyltransferase